MTMATSRITVYRNGKPLVGASVSLEYSGFTQMGFTKKFTTNREGVAYVEHSSTGKAKIYVNGSSQRSMNTPGEEAVYL